MASPAQHRNIAAHSSDVGSSRCKVEKFQQCDDLVGLTYGIEQHAAQLDDAADAELDGSKQAVNAEMACLLQVADRT